MSATVATEPGREYALRIIRDARHRSAAAAPQVADWLRWLELVRELAPGSIDAYEFRVALLLRLYPHTPLEAFTEAELMAALAKIPQPSRRGYVSAFRSLFRAWAFNRDLIAKDPTRLLGEVRAKRGRYLDTFTEAEVEALTGLPGDDGLRMLLMFDTGLRIGELCRLRVRNVQVERSQIVVLGSRSGGGGKGDKDRIVPMTSRLLQAFSDWSLVEGVHRDDYVVAHQKGGAGRGVSHRRTPLTEDAYRAWFYKALDRAGVRKLKPHATRHTFATILLRRGASMVHVRDLLGHSSIQVTVDLYGHLVTDDLRGVMELLEA